ncbi:MAG: cysteine methyltransferase [Bacteroidetes bacterium]|nr:MAG: cysteine methyltransferase [Bacteroidota bacterium]MBL1143874.1 MGMT family protein [Bacteroidota bacterium]MCB0801516.1 MGMT family protein [Flavobacteriales bacterium]NOG56675.1 MGMT family protein [Bacteroidota bacterium]
MTKTIKLSEKNKDFFEMVYQVVRLIPAGRVSSYGAVAKYLGAARGARMVGWAMNASHAQAEYVPAHRVVNRLGMLSGKAHFPSESPMQKSLEAEGIEVIDDQVQDFKRLFWDPSIEVS